MITAWALLGTAVLSLFIAGDAPESRSSAPPPGTGIAKPGKSSLRRGAADGTKALSPEAAEAAIRRWLKSSADRSSPPLEACRALNAAAVERLLRDPVYGWTPLTNYSRGDALPAHWEETRKALMPFYKALLERWAEADFRGAVAEIPPTSDYNEDSNLAWVIFTEAAKTDPAMAFQALHDWHGGLQRLPPFWTASHDVMQAWSAVDSESSWQWLAGIQLDEDDWRTTARGYLKGLDHHDWPSLLEKAETLSGGEPDKTNPRASMRLEMIRAWGYEDPLAALASFDRQSGDPIRNPYPGYAADPDRERNVNFSILLWSWMSADPGVAEKLQSWRPENFNTDGIFRVTAINGGLSDVMRQQARDLIHDPKVAAEVDAQMELMRPKISIPQFCGPAHQGPVEGQK